MPQELIINPVAYAYRDEKQSPSEMKRVRRFMETGANIDSLIPDDIGASEYQEDLRAACVAIARSQLISEAVMPVLGRLLVVASEHPELYSDQHESWSAFMESISQTYGLGRSTLYEARRMYERWAGVLGVGEFEQIGRVSLNLLSKAVPRGDEGKATAKKLIEKAKQVTSAALRKFCVDKGYLEAGEDSGGYFSVPCNKRQLKLFNQWFKDARVQSRVGSGAAAEILEAMIGECQSSAWLVEEPLPEPAITVDAAAAEPEESFEGVV